MATVSVGQKFLIFRQFLDCISLDFQDHCMDQYIYVLVSSIQLLILVIYQSIYGYLFHFQIPEM